MNEAETRAEHTDPALRAAGWGVVEGSRIRREYAISPGRIEGRAGAESRRSSKPSSRVSRNFSTRAKSGDENERKICFPT